MSAEHGFSFVPCSDSEQLSLWCWCPVSSAWARALGGSPLSGRHILLISLFSVNTFLGLMSRALSSHRSLPNLAAAYKLIVPFFFFFGWGWGMRCRSFPERKGKFQSLNKRMTQMLWRTETASGNRQHQKYKTFCRLTVLPVAPRFLDSPAIYWQLASRLLCSPPFTSLTSRCLFRCSQLYKKL